MGDASTTFHALWNVHFQQAAFIKVAIDLKNKTNFGLVLGLLHNHWNITVIIEKLYIVYSGKAICCT